LGIFKAVQLVSMSGAEVKCSLKMSPGAHEVQFIVKLVADGQLKIARHFNGGSRGLEFNTVPLGMAGRVRRTAGASGSSF
jgi:hypothetical protein